MAIDIADAIGAFKRARSSIRAMADHGDIGSRHFADRATDATQDFGMGVEGMWTATARNEGGVPRAVAHDLLDGLHDLGKLEGAGAVARQRSGYMDIPDEQHIVMRRIYADAERAVDLLRRGPKGDRGMELNARAGYEALQRAARDLEQLDDYRRIGGRSVIREAESAGRNLGRGIEELWALTSRDRDAVPSAAAHDMLIHLKDVGRMEGAAKVAGQRSGYMNIPFDMIRDLDEAARDAERAADLLRRH